jgi:hypothetical protein
MERKGGGRPKARPPVLPYLNNPTFYVKIMQKTHLGIKGNGISVTGRGGP